MKDKQTNFYKLTIVDFTQTYLYCMCQKNNAIIIGIVMNYVILRCNSSIL